MSTLFENAAKIKDAVDEMLASYDQLVRDRDSLLKDRANLNEQCTELLRKQNAHLAIEEQE